MAIRKKKGKSTKSNRKAAVSRKGGGRKMTIVKRGGKRRMASKSKGKYKGR